MNHVKLIKRNLCDALEAALGDTPVVLVVGPRQAGKTTLCRIVGDPRGMRFISLDDTAVRAAASHDPDGFVAGLDGPVLVDEIQKAPELLPAIKLAVDRRRVPGRFLLTGSADVLALPRVAESLAGRMEVLALHPLSQGEMEGRQEGFIDFLFAHDPPSARPSPASRADLVRRALQGGFPESVARRDPERRRAWFRSYVTAVLDRDVRDLARIEGLTEMPRLLHLLAARSASLLNIAELSRTTGMPHATLTRYLTLLERTFLVRLLPSWSSGRTRRLIRTPRVSIADTGLLGHLAGMTPERIEEDPNPTGPLFETFVAGEIEKQLGWSRTSAGLFHFRTYGGREVDLVLERDDGRIVGIEVKSAGSLAPSDRKGIETLRETAGRRFHRGVILYTGRETLPFGPDTWALPLDALWTLDARGEPIRPPPRRT